MLASLQLHHTPLIKGKRECFAVRTASPSISPKGRAWFSSSHQISLTVLFKNTADLNKYILCKRGSLVAQMVKNLPAMQEMWVQSLGREDPLEMEMATHSSILAWEILWTEEPGGLRSMGSQRVGHNWVTKCVHMCVYTQTLCKTCCTALPL